jgi:hypothetical protein
MWMRWRGRKGEERRAEMARERRERRGGRVEDGRERRGGRGEKRRERKDEMSSVGNRSREGMRK